jgi:acetylornithine/succinyldiaminopimelate/putrescine aminotransferase
LLLAQCCFDRVFFTSTGAEANEGAIKLARKWGQLQKNGAAEIITTHHGFHGRTLTTMSATGKEQWKNLFEPKTKGFVKAIFNDLDSVERVVSANTCSIMLEPIQGEGGVNVATKEFISGLRTLCDRHNILLIFDEIQTGMGRTGKMFALDHHEGVKADIMCLAKGLGSGMPIGACVARADIMDWHKGAHASTFGGNPVALTAALKTIELLQGGLVDNSRDVGAYLEAGLRKLGDKYDCIGDVRGLGMMLGVEFVTDKASLTPAPELRDAIEMACFKRGLIILGCGTNSIRFSPPLILAREHVDVALEIFDEAIGASCS